MDNASTATSPPAAWHPDPHVPGQMRWWNGVQWTDHVQPVAPQAAGFPVAGQPIVQQSAQAVPYQPADPRDSHVATGHAAGVQRAAETKSIVEANPASFYAIGIAATYLVIALYTGIVFFGILPAYFGFKAFSAREKLAPLAIVAAGVAIAFAITHRSTS
jgi:hypothetical protein